MIQRIHDSGEVAKTYRYDAFGNEETPEPLDANPFRYCGEYFDAETATLYLRARSYDPRSGRFTQEDSAKDGGNWYAYCGGNPVGLVDPSGHKSKGSNFFGDELKDKFKPQYRSSKPTVKPFNGIIKRKNFYDGLMDGINGLELPKPKLPEVDWKKVGKDATALSDKLVYIQQNKPTLVGLDVSAVTKYEPAVYSWGLVPMRTTEIYTLSSQKVVNAPITIDLSHRAGTMDTSIGVSSSPVKASLNWSSNELSLEAGVEIGKYGVSVEVGNMGSISGSFSRELDELSTQVMKTTIEPPAVALAAAAVAVGFCAPTVGIALLSYLGRALSYA